MCLKAWGPILRVQYQKCVINMWEDYISLWSFLSFSFFSCLFLFVFFFFFFFFITHNEWVHKHKILVALIFIMVIHRVIAQVVALQWGVIGQRLSMMNAMLFFIEFVDMTSRICNKWRYERVMGNMKNEFLGSFFWKDVSIGNKVKLWHFSFID